MTPQHLSNCLWATAQLRNYESALKNVEPLANLGSCYYKVTIRVTIRVTAMVAIRAIQTVAIRVALEFGD